MKSSAYAVGFAVGIMLTAIACVVIRKLLKHKTKLFCNEYDERQKAIQGIGYKMAYMTTFVLVVLCAVLSETIDCFPFGMLDCMFICIWIPLCVFVTYCIIKDAYLSLRTSRKSLLVLWLAAGLLNIGIALYYIILDGGDRNCFGNLLTGASLIYMSAVMVAKALAERKCGEE